MIEFENVSFSYTGQEHGGLHDINLKISDGECVLFCGRSGCGKTTITRLVNGLIPQFYQGELHGRVLVDGQEISNIPMYQIAAKVGSVFQNPRTQFFNVDTDSEIAFGIENEACPPKKLAERVEQTTEDLHIQKLRNRNIFELSGGEKQKIAFASVYAMNPQIYLLDEPSSNLDMTSIQELREHLRLIKKQGKTVLIAEHRLYYLTELADRIVYLEKGEIKGIYTSEEFRQLSEHEREQMGLRAVDLQAVFPPQTHSLAPAPALELRNVTLHYKKQTILHDIVLSAGKGEVIGVVGHNGAGKTTFSRTLCGLHKDCDGQFLWESKPIERKERLQRSYMVMQDVNYELFADSVEAECSFGIRNPDQTLVNATLEELGLSTYREQHPNTLSGGQKQRVAVAVSMICGKDLLVFDEPTSGLDFDSMTQVAGLIRRLSNMGKVIFIVTHDFEFVCRTCSRVLHFDEGEIPDDVLVTMDALPKLRELFSVKVNVSAGDRERVREYVADSPFEYQKNCLLYLPKDLKKCRRGSQEEAEMIADHIHSLICSTYGHTLVLFTSYHLMGNVYQMLRDEIPFPMIGVWRHSPEEITRFKQTDNAVLFAAGSCWEGVDFPGDMVSSLIIVKLPFAVPDPISEAQKKEFDCLKDYIQAVIVPDMQKKLRQGFGRALRTETDTCVVSILDERAGEDGRYHEEVMCALPSCKMAKDIKDVQRFIRNRKGVEYYL